MFSKASIDLYDLIYASRGKDYRKETAYLLRTLAPYRLKRSTRLLDVACGTGMHLQWLKRRFPAAEGLDLSPDFIRVAQRNNPDLRFHLGDMRAFSIAAKYDLITCLFSSIGYMTSLVDLRRAIRNMASHLTRGGLMLVEPWFPPNKWKVGRLSMLTTGDDALRIVRMNTTARRGRVSSFDLHYLVGTPKGITHFVERHRSGLFTVQDMLQAFRNAGLQVEYDEKGPTGRGLYVGRLPKAG
jgi:trans-aconitate methyltransferase